MPLTALNAFKNHAVLQTRNDTNLEPPGLLTYPLWDFTPKRSLPPLRQYYNGVNAM